MANQLTGFYGDNMLQNNGNYWDKRVHFLRNGL